MKLQTYRPKIEFEKTGIELLALFLHICLFVLGGLLLAKWAWHFYTPATLAIPPKIEQSTSSQLTTILAAHWFNPPKGQSVVIPVAKVDFKLVGIYASTNNHASFAVFKLADGKQKAVLLNQEINAAINLQGVHPDHVEVGQEGNTQKLYLGIPKSSNNPGAVLMPNLEKP